MFKPITQSIVLYRAASGLVIRFWLVGCRFYSLPPWGWRSGTLFSLVFVLMFALFYLMRWRILHHPNGWAARKKRAVA